MARTGRPREMYKRNRKQKTSGDKIEKAQKALERLQKRVKEEGETAWLKDAIQKAEAKLKKFGVRK